MATYEEMTHRLADSLKKATDGLEQRRLTIDQLATDLDRVRGERDRLRQAVRYHMTMGEYVTPSDEEIEQRDFSDALVRGDMTSG